MLRIKPVITLISNYRLQFTATALQDGNSLSEFLDVSSIWSNIAEGQLVVLPLELCLIWGLGSDWRGSSSRLEQGSGEMGLSAAVSVCCSVWKTSVMDYLMVIVWSGDGPSSCLPRDISRVCSKLCVCFCPCVRVWELRLGKKTYKCMFRNFHFTFTLLE